MMVTDSDQPATQGPYGRAAAAYWRAGWRGVLPLPPREKGTPPKGYTGAAGVFPSWPDVQAWLEEHAAGNLALRLPHDVLGIDVDAYGDKPGAATLDAAIARFGPLPATWCSSSRPAPSGISLYRVPEGLAWPGELGAGVELIQHRHRYVVAPPSLHPEGRAYAWRTPDGRLAPDGALPHPESLPPLPERWVAGLTGGAAAVDVARADLGTAAAGAWLIARDPAGPAELAGVCPRMARALDVALLDLTAAGSTHEAVRASVMRLSRLAAEGHPGGTAALSRLAQAFTTEVTRPGRDGRRAPQQADTEWRNMLTGAVNLLAAEPDKAAPSPVDPCSNPFAGVASPLRPAPAVAPLIPPPAPSSLHTPLHTAAAPRLDRPALHLVDDEDPGDLRALMAGGGAASGLGSGAETGQPAPFPPLAAPPRDRTSWYARDLTGVLTGRHDDPTATPAYLARSDGKLLLYPGRVNALLGEAESGKTWIALEAIRQTLARGEAVTMLDFEDTAAGTIARLRLLGCTDDHLTGFAYLDPDETLHPQAGLDLSEHLAEHRPGLILLDGVNAAMTLLGLDLESNTDATRFAQLVTRPLAATGAAVLLIDHLPKNRENRGKGGIGAQAKRAMQTGAAITFDVITPPAPGRVGKLTGTVDKDRPGAVRGVSLGGRNVGTVLIDSETDPGRVTVSIEAPKAAKTTDGKFRPTALMERASTFLAATPTEWVSGSQIQAGCGGNAQAMREALQRLVEEGNVERKPGPRGSSLHRHARPFRADDVVDLEAPVAPGQAAAVSSYWQQVTEGDEEALDDEGGR